MNLRVRRVTGEEASCYVEEKRDGVSLCAEYESGAVVNSWTTTRSREQLGTESMVAAAVTGINRTS